MAKDGSLSRLLRSSNQEQLLLFKSLYEMRTRANESDTPLERDELVAAFDASPPQSFDIIPTSLIHYDIAGMSMHERLLKILGNSNQEQLRLLELLYKLQTITADYLDKKSKKRVDKDRLVLAFEALPPQHFDEGRPDPGLGTGDTAVAAGRANMPRSEEQDDDLESVNTAPQNRVMGETGTEVWNDNPATRNTIFGGQSIKMRESGVTNSDPEIEDNTLGGQPTIMSQPEAGYHDLASDGTRQATEGSETAGKPHAIGSDNSILVGQSTEASSPDDSPDDINTRNRKPAGLCITLLNVFLKITTFMWLMVLLSVSPISGKYTLTQHSGDLARRDIVGCGFIMMVVYRYGASDTGEHPSATSCLVKAFVGAVMFAIATYLLAQLILSSST